MKVVIKIDDLEICLQDKRVSELSRFLKIYERIRRENFREVSFIAAVKEWMAATKGKK
jgi:hypothetical protein